MNNELVKINPEILILSDGQVVEVTDVAIQEKLAEDLLNPENKGAVICVNGNIINTAFMTGFYKRQDYTPKGFWRCSLGNLHENGQKCEDKEACFLNNHKRLKEINYLLQQHMKTGVCTESRVKMQDQEVHLCEYTVDLIAEKNTIYYEANAIGNKKYY